MLNHLPYRSAAVQQIPDGRPKFIQLEFFDPATIGRAPKASDPSGYPGPNFNRIAKKDQAGFPAGLTDLKILDRDAIQRLEATDFRTVRFFLKTFILGAYPV